MYSKKRTLAEQLTLVNKRMDLPRDAVIDKVFLHVSLTLKNEDTTNDWTGTYGAVLERLKELRIVSDGNNVHYALNFNDLAILNYMDYQGCSLNPDGALTVGKAAEKDISFVLVLDEGDILAVTKDSLEISIDVDTAVSASPAVKITALTATVTLEENIFTVPEFQATYGAALEASAEPKITTISKSFDASDELREFLDLPTGTLLRRTVLLISDTSGKRGGADPAKIGLVRTTPERSETYTVHYPTLREFNRRQYRVDTLVAGAVLIDYGSEITNDPYGIRGWKYNKGDYQLAVKSAAEGRIRYISCEYVVNTKAFDVAARAIMEQTP